MAIETMPWNMVNRHWWDFCVCKRRIYAQIDRMSVSIHASLTSLRMSFAKRFKCEITLPPTFWFMKTCKKCVISFWQGIYRNPMCAISFRNNFLNNVAAREFNWNDMNGVESGVVCHTYTQKKETMSPAIIFGQNWTTLTREMRVNKVMLLMTATAFWLILDERRQIQMTKLPCSIRPLTIYSCQEWFSFDWAE